MLILAIDSSASPASAAVLEDGKLLGEFFVNTKQTHSQTLLPMVENLLKALCKTCGEIDLFAVSSGPGSFTGIRIGVSCVKGLALPNNTPCCGVSTLEAIAMGGISCEGALICAVMDARCGQVYNALFRVEQGSLQRLTADRALSLEDLEAECAPFGEQVILFGDGATLCHKTFSQWGARLAPEPIRFQRASSVALAAVGMAERKETVTAAELLPGYLRLPQAERELKKRKEKEGSGT